MSYYKGDQEPEEDLYLPGTHAARMLEVPEGNYIL